MNEATNAAPLLAVPAKCPRCKHAVPGLFLSGKTLLTKDGVILGSFWCGSCQRIVHFPIDKQAARKETAPK